MSTRINPLDLHLYNNSSGCYTVRNTETYFPIILAYTANENTLQCLDENKFRQISVTIYNFLVTARNVKTRINTYDLHRYKPRHRRVISDHIGCTSIEITRENV